MLSTVRIYENVYGTPVVRGSLLWTELADESYTISDYEPLVSPPGSPSSDAATSSDDTASSSDSSSTPLPSPNCGPTTTPPPPRHIYQQKQSSSEPSLPRTSTTRFVTSRCCYSMLHLYTVTHYSAKESWYDYLQQRQRQRQQLSSASAQHSINNSTTRFVIHDNISVAVVLCLHPSPIIARWSQCTITYSNSSNSSNNSSSRLVVNLLNPAPTTQLLGL